MESAVVAAWAGELGFARMGICSTDLFAQQKKAVDAQPELRERRQLRYDPQGDCPWATALLVLLWPYPQAPLPRDEERVFIDSYYAASNRAYQAAKALGEKLRHAGYRAQANVSYPARTAAVRAGLGIIGDNGLLIVPGHGTRVVIILLATDAVSAQKQDGASPGECMHCGRCAKACPVGALEGCGMAHPERCLRNFMMEGMVVPEATRAKMGMKLVGCDMCQRVCPMQTGEESGESMAFQLDDFLTADETAFRESVSRLGGVIGRNMARPQRVRAQAALLAGNRGRARDLDVLRGWEESEFEAVREHARWAIRQIERYTLGLDQSCEKR